MKKVGVVRFLGTNCDRDIIQACETFGHQPSWLWYEDEFDPASVDAVIIPGGFSYGDYLRCGAIAAKAPVMKSVAEFSKLGKPILGICNGFQILCEAGLLPGVLLPNESGLFVDKWVQLKKGSSSQHWGAQLEGARLPVAHGEGRFYLDSEGLKSLEDNNQVWWRYEENVNGSLNDIAGILNKEKNVAGLMPHPERAIFEWMGGKDGAEFFTL